MTITLVSDEFGLLHAAVPHPCRPRQNIQVMVLQAEDGWWAYVDGERVPGAYPSAQQAGRAASQTIDQFRTLADEVVTGARIRQEQAIRQATHRTVAPITSRTRSNRLASRAIAATAAVAFFGVTAFVVQATGVLNGASLSTHADVRASATPVVDVALQPPAVERTRAAVTVNAAKSERLLEPFSAPKVNSTSLQPAPGRTTTVAPLPAIEPKSVTVPTIDVASWATVTTQVRSAAIDVPEQKRATAVATISKPKVTVQKVSKQVATRAPSRTVASRQNAFSDLRRASLGAPKQDPKADRPATKPTFKAPHRLSRARVQRARAGFRPRVKRRRTASFRAAKRRRVQRLRSRGAKRYTRRARKLRKQRKYRRVYKKAFAQH